MREKYTPGPWAFTGEPYGYTVWQAAREGGDNPQSVARIVGGRKGGVANEEANARLIAAAPELLEAATATLARLDLEAAEKGEGTVFPCNALRDDLRRAIRKAAEGRAGE